MPISINESPATAKAWSPALTASATGVSLAALSVLFGSERFDVPAMSIPCVYDGEPTTYRLALCRHASGPAVVLVEDEDIPAGYEQVVYLARWRLASASDTCDVVAIEVPTRTLAPHSIVFPVIDIPEHTVPVLDETGDPVLDPNGVPMQRTIEATHRLVVIEYGAPTGLHRDVSGDVTATIADAPATFAELASALVVDVAEITSRIPAPPTVFAVSATPVLPTVNAARTASRKLKQRIRDLRQQARDLKQAGTTYSAMTAAQRQIIQELVALTGEPAPLAVP
jgi:hypothetical protein